MRKIKFFAKIVFLLLIATMISCSTIKVINVNAVEEFKEHTLIYSLPKTVINIEVEFKKTEYKKGPYYKFANKYLGIDKVIERNETKWKINDIEIKNSILPDSSKFYLLYTNDKNISSKINLSNDGILKSFNKRVNDDTPKLCNKFFNNENQEIEFYDLTVKKHFEEITETSYKIIKTDTSEIKVPVYDKKISEKGLEKKAEEAANFIFKIRKRRLRIITGQDDIVLEGNTAEKIIEELDEIEKRYVQLFTGVKKTVKTKYYFEYEPISKNTKPELLFKYIDNKGLVDKRAKSGTPVYISVRSMNYTNVIDSLYAKAKKPITEYKGIVYRIPENSIVELYEHKKPITKEIIPINQFGVINIIPASLLKGDDIKIDFYDNNGSLRRISTVNNNVSKKKRND